MNKKEPSQFALTELSKDELLLRMTFLGKSSAENKFAAILKILASSNDAKKLAAIAFSLHKNASKISRGRRVQSVSEFENLHRSPIAVAKLKWREKLTDAEALRRISEKHKVEFDALRLAYYRNKRALDGAAQANNPHRK